MNTDAQAFAAEPMPALPYRSECFAEDVADEATPPQALQPPQPLRLQQDTLRWPAAMLVAAPLGAALLGALAPALLS